MFLICFKKSKDKRVLNNKNRFRGKSFISKYFIFIYALVFSLSLAAQFEPRPRDNNRSYNTVNPLPQQGTEAVVEKNKGLPIYIRFEHRLILAYLIQSIGLSDEEKNKLAIKMKKTMSTLAKRGVEWVNVNSKDEYLRLQKANWPDTHNLTLDLKIIQDNIADDNSFKIKMYYSDDPSIQNQIVSHQLDSAEYILNVLKDNKSSIIKEVLWFSLENLINAVREFKFMESVNSIVLDNLKALSNKLNMLTLNNEQSFSLQDQLDQKSILLAFETSEKFISTIMNESVIIDSILTQFEDIQIGAAEKKVFEIIFINYFKYISLNSKKLILNAILGLPINSTHQDKFRLMVQLADPILQKCLQLFSRQKGMSPELAEIFKSLESSNRPVPWFIAEKIINSESDNYTFRNISKTPLGVGTQRQQHRAELILPNGDVVNVIIGFTKPRIQELLNEGTEIFNKIIPLVDRDPLVKGSHLPKLNELIPDMVKGILLEQDTGHVREMHSKFFEVYHRSDFNLLKDYGYELTIQAPKIYSPAGRISNLLVQEFVKGDELDSAIKKSEIKNLNLKKVLSEQLFMLWFYELIFGSGLFHGDLHHGNLKVDINREDKKIVFSILDYGMTGELTLKARSQFVKLGASIELLDSNTMSEIFWEMRDIEITKITKEELKQSISNEIKSQGLGANREMIFWMKFVSSKNYKLKTEFIEMMRGFITAKNLLIEVESDLKEEKVAKKMMLSNPLRGALVTLLGSLNTPLPSFWGSLKLMMETDSLTHSESSALQSIIQGKSNQCKKLFR